MIKEAIKKIARKEDLSYEEANQVMDEIMSGETSDIQTSAFLTGLSMKGETIDEISGCAAGMRAHCVKVLNDLDAAEIVGTGGDGSNSFNISTTAAIVTAAGGVPVAKHGNRAATSKCGTADCFEALGVNISVSPEKSAQLLKEIGLCFLFAQNYHISMKYVAPVRKELGIRTVFNILGPLANPAGANMELMGVYDEELVQPLSEVLEKLGVKRGMVVYGQDCLDEISMSAPTTVCEFHDGERKCYRIEPEDFGFEKCAKEDLVGGTPEENAEITRSILKGEQGPRRNAVLLNAGAALYMAGKYETLADGVRAAGEIIDSGKAIAKLEEFIQRSNEA
ncbi:MAG: anthranilate phosphoribosyltransferase [Hespellia sp.]|nr:anthranilate phosphoribosyltransferase [Hespellia sp.]